MKAFKEVKVEEKRWVSLIKEIIPYFEGDINFPSILFFNQAINNFQLEYNHEFKMIYITCNISDKTFSFEIKNKHKEVEVIIEKHILKIHKQNKNGSN